jgi:hypothetical protein
MWQHQLALKGGNMPRLFFALFFLSAPALANSVITIGTFTYLGPNSQGQSQYEIELNTNGVTAEPFTLVGVAIGSNNGGATFEIPTTADFDLTITGGGFGNCPCTSIFLSLGISPSGRPVTFLLANGTPFTAYALDTSTLLPLSGQFSPARSKRSNYVNSRAGARDGAIDRLRVGELSHSTGAINYPEKLAQELCVFSPDLTQETPRRKRQVFISSFGRLCARIFAA